MKTPFCVAGAIFIATWPGMSVHADLVDDFVNNEMRAHNIPGLSLAVIQDGKIIRAQGYGFTDKSGKAPVTPDTLFQAGSISKPVAALATLHLVEQGRLSLDAEVNTELRSWKMPENEFTKAQKVTLRRILNHTAGFNLHGFPGYATDVELPTLVQVLDGLDESATLPIRVDTLPGSQWRYSGGGYTVMQQMVVDVTDRPFPEFMEETVLKPLGMTNSTYEQPLPANLAPAAASGYGPLGTEIRGQWHVYPEMAAAGLWTTASDLARFAMGVQQSAAGTNNPVISQGMTWEMLSVTNLSRNLKGLPKSEASDGLGVFLKYTGGRLWFEHDGRNAGFDALMTASATSGQGAVIMIDANDNSGAIRRIMEVISQEYHWSDPL